jgi:hypothetical protein
MFKGFALHGEGENMGLIVKCGSSSLCENCFQCDSGAGRRAPYARALLFVMCPSLDTVIRSLMFKLMGSNKYANVWPLRHGPLDGRPEFQDMPLLAEYSKSGRGKPVVLTPPEITAFLNNWIAQLHGKTSARKYAERADSFPPIRNGYSRVGQSIYSAGPAR